MIETDHLHLTRAAQRDLLGALAEIPRLVEHLAITIAKQARTAKPGATNYRKRRRLDGSAPVNTAAFDAEHELHNTLTTWVRLVCEERHLTPPRNDLLTLATWLGNNISHLAVCEGAGEAPDDIERHLSSCWRHIDLPPEDDTQTEAANREKALDSMVTLSTVTAVARKLGPLGEGLTERRLRTLTKSAGVRPVSTDVDSGTNFYRLRDVLDAHHRHRTRREAS